jgi:hypothetical protein
MVTCDEKKMRKVLDDLARKYDDTNVYTQEEWADRGESMGEGSVFTLVCEGELHHLLNGYGKGRAGDMTVDKLNEVARKHGFWWDRGFSWSYHFYRL